MIKQNKIAGLSHKYRNAQYSMEFIIFFALLSIMFLIWLIVYLDLNDQAFQKRDSNAMTDLGKSIQTYIFAASAASTGFYSNSLVIPDKAGPVSYTVNNTNYMITLTANKNDFTFSIPYTLGYLKKGQNDIYSVNGVVAIGFRPLIDANGTIRFAQCSDGIDNDNDLLIDAEDGGCWTNTTGTPIYDPNKDYETPNNAAVPVAPNVCNYYVVCKNAQETTDPTYVNMCGFIDGSNGFTQQDCCHCSGYCC